MLATDETVPARDRTRGVELAVELFTSAEDGGGEGDEGAWGKGMAGGRFLLSAVGDICRSRRRCWAEYSAAGVLERPDGRRCTGGPTTLSSLDRLESLPSEFRGVEEEDEEFSFSVREPLRPVFEYLLVDEAGRGLLVAF